VLNHLRHRNLLNWPDDPVKVVFHPQFITSTSPVLGLEYDQFVRGCNLGLFPSYYEPWGYTPMECVIRGIPAITSDLSGFGSYAMTHFPDHDDNGIFVARRRGATFASTTAQVTSWLYALTRMSRRERIQLRNRVESHAEHFDWSNMTSTTGRLTVEPCRSTIPSRDHGYRGRAETDRRHAHPRAASRRGAASPGPSETPDVQLGEPAPDPRLRFADASRP